MKAFKKSICLVLSALMLVSVFAVGSLTAGAASITSVTIDGIFEPAEGNRFDDTAFCLTSGCDISKISWYDYANNKWMTSNDSFIQGNVYEANINVQAKEGNSFVGVSSVTGTINSQTATVSKVTMEDPEEYLNFSLKFTATEANSKIGSANITGVTEPAAGSKLDFSYNDSSSLYNIEAFEWRNPDTDDIYSKSYIAEANTTYQARFYLTPKEGYQFFDNIVATVNGVKAEVYSVSGYTELEKAVVICNFNAGDVVTEPETTEPATEPATVEPEETTAPIDENSITNIGVVSVVEPEIGEKANDKAYPFYGSPFNIQSVAWYNKTDGYMMMIGDDKFEANKTYTARVKVSVKSGYSFNNPTATINEKTAKVFEEDGYDKEISLLVTCDFSTPAEQSDPEMITDVNITGVVEPVERQTPALIASGEDKYFVEAVTWFNCTDKVAIEAPETFEKGKEYAANIFLRPHAGYRFNYDPKNIDKLDINATVNGQTADSYMVTGGYGGKYVEVNCSFIATEADIKETTAPVEETTAPETTEPPTDKSTEPEETSTESEAVTTEPQTQPDTTSTNPIVIPTIPEVIPTDPVVNPTTPEVNPTDPIVNPTNPEVDPTYPVVTPTTPEVNPTNPVVIPTTPEVNPTNPVVNPTNPEANPTAPPAKTVTNKNANPVKVVAKAKTVKAKKVKKKKVTVKPLTIKNAQGNVKITKVKKGTTSKIYKKIKVNSKTGAITFKKGKYKKKTYKVKLKIVVSGNAKFNAKTIYKTVKIKIK